MISVGFKTDRGKNRVDNEDSVFVLPDRQIYMVADGVGGHNSGELASRMAVGYMAQFVALNPLQFINEASALKNYFLSLFSGANELIYSKSVNEKTNRGMATTAVICYLRDGKAYVVNVGDSRCYLVRDGAIMQVTRDHTLVQELQDKGLITPEEAENRPDKNMITRALGGEETVNPDFFVFNTYPGDTIILCTDGLYSEVPDGVMSMMASSSNAMHKLSAELVNLANSNGGSDNISVVCIRISE